MKQNKRLGITAIGIIASVVPSFGQQTSSPNILLVITDDLGTDALSIYNSNQEAITANTPNLIRLSENGITFDNVWASALSSPTRASILTGRYGFRTGVMDVQSDLPEKEVSLHSYLAQQTENEYASSIIGKWHLSRDVDSPSRFGVEHFAGYMGGSVRNYSNWTLTTNGVNTQETEYITTKLTDLAIDWIGEEELRNTIIIFVGDNGTDRNLIQAPYSFEQGKGTVYQGGVVVPMIVSGVGVKREGERDDNLICVTDLFSTIVELAGAKQNRYEDSYSFKPLLNAESKGVRDYNYTEIKNRRSGYTNAIRNQRYKLISADNETKMLFDLLSDPYEKHNLLDNKLNAEQKDALVQLQKQLKNLRK